MVSGGENLERKAQAWICFETCRRAYKKRTSAAGCNLSMPLTKEEEEHKVKDKVGVGEEEKEKAEEVEK